MTERQPKNREEAIERNLGVQPIDALLTQMNLENHDLVAASTEQITHKMVARARKGRRLTRNTKTKVGNALNQALLKRDGSLDASSHSLADLFNY